MKRQSIIDFEKQEYNWELANNKIIPPYAIVRPKYDDTTANGLTKLIIAYCRFNGWHAERINTEGRVIDNTKKVYDTLGNQRIIGSIKRIPTAGMRGSADIHILKKGVAIFCEVKIGKDRQSDAQKAYQKSVESSGGKYIIATDFDSFLNKINVPE